MDSRRLHTYGTAVFTTGTEEGTWRLRLAARLARPWLKTKQAHQILEAQRLLTAWAAGSFVAAAG